MRLSKLSQRGSNLTASSLRSHRCKSPTYGAGFQHLALGETNPILNNLRTTRPAEARAMINNFLRLHPFQCQSNRPRFDNELCI